MPELRFREDEPQRTAAVSPPIVERTEVVSAPHAAIPEQKVRYAEWLSEEHAVPTDPLRVPKWLFIALSAAILAATGQILYRALGPWPEPPYGFGSGAPIVVREQSPEYVGPAGLILLASLIVLVASWIIQGRRDSARIRKHMPAEPIENDGPVPWRSLYKARERGELDAVVTMFQDGYAYGTDYGRLRFEESSLYFEGARTHFSLSKRRLVLDSRIKLNGMQSENAVFSYTSDGVKYAFTFWQLGVNDGLVMERSFYQPWLAEPSRVAEYEVLLPRSVPTDAPRQALAAIRRPLLAAEVFAFLAALSGYPLLVQAQFESRNPLSGHVILASGPGDGPSATWSAVLLLILAALWLDRCLRRYLFLRDRLREQAG